MSAPSPQFNDLPDPCSFGVHDWVTKRNDEREDYDVCLRCGQQAGWTPLPPEGLLS